MKTGVLVMAYGTPRDLDDVEAYYTDIRHGRPPPPELLKELRERYKAIGGRSPLREITEAQADGLAQRLGLPAYVGMKHATPSIPDAVAAVARDGVERAVGLVLAPHYSAMSVGDYARRAGLAATDLRWEGTIDVIESWHLEPAFIGLLRARVADARGSLDEELQDEAVVVFTAHSLPERILQANDPYPAQLHETAEAVAATGSITRWVVGWQSAGRTNDPWLGPDLLEVLDDLASDGVRSVIVCPCGFVSDHLEVLYDVDIEAKKHAEKLGIQLVRTASLNDDPAFLDALAGVVQARLTR